MITTNKARVFRTRRLSTASVAALLIAVAGCRPSDGPATPSSQTTLTIGFGLSTGVTAQAGIRQTARNISLEGLVAIGRDGRPQPWLAKSWTMSSNGLVLRMELRPGATFHNGQLVTASVVRDILVRQPPIQLGPAFGDIAEVRALADTTVEFSLTRPSAFLLEGLDGFIEQPSTVSIGTGPFQVASSDDQQMELRSNENYYLGKPFIDRILIRPYASVRSAWAEMLRGRVDMLYEVGLDALDSLEPSKDARVFVHQRPYSYVVLLNFRNPVFASKEFRRKLNAAIDRQTLVTETLQGHATPADGPVWPGHWAYENGLPTFRYKPEKISPAPKRFTCLFADASLERLGLGMQRQLRAVGVDLELELVSIDDWYERIKKGDFDAVLADAVSGPNLVRPYLVWHSEGPLNYGRFNGTNVDAALDAIRTAPNDDAYKAGVAAFQKAIIDDPPAIFLAWSERARAVSTRFAVPAEPGRDILPTLRLWRPATDKPAMSPN
jgi:peptide/nickel transport system substrate-binding protein